MIFQMQNGFDGGMLKQCYHETIPPGEAFSLTKPRRRRNLVFDKWRNGLYAARVLGSGIILLKDYLTFKAQVDIVSICQEAAMGPGGGFRPRSGADGLGLRMMCFGQYWDPVTKYEEPSYSDGPGAPPIPYEFISLSDNAIQDAQSHIEKLPSMLPNFCLANFYSVFGRLAVHQDCDEHISSLESGLPVVSISIGAPAEFLYGDTEDESKLDTVLLESGDVLIFGGESRLIYHGLKEIFPQLAPLQLLKESSLKQGRLNLTLKCSTYLTR